MAELVEPIRDRHGDAPALCDESGVTTWRELDATVERWIGAFHGAGLRPGDRVAFVLGNRRETFEALLACLHTGLVAVPVNWHLTAAEIAHLLTDSAAVAVLTEDAYVETVTEAVRQAGVAPRLMSTVDELARLPATPGAERCSGTVMLYTSGTSGRPKGVVNRLLRVGAPLSKVAGTAEAAARTLGIPADRRALLVGPWYHSAQLFFSQFPLLRGCTVVMRRRFDPDEVLDLLDTARINISHLVPTQFIRLLHAGRDRPPPSGLIRIWHGGSPCPPDVKRAMIDWWGPVFVEYYAATECGVATLIDSADWLRRPGSVGRAVAGTHVVVASPTGDVLPARAEGAVAIRRPPGRGFEYHNAPEQTRAAHLAADLFTVGDIGYLDEDGYLFLTARSAEVIVSGGVNIYPAEVEAALLAHPGVRDAAVVGVPDGEFGERVAALVERDPLSDVDTAELDRHCRARLAGFKVPRFYEFVGRLPREPTGKLARAALREPYWQQTGRRI